MSWKCKWFDCKPEKVKNLDSEGNYYLTQCKRCGAEKVHFVREDAVYSNEKSTMRAVRKCQQDKDFFKKCICYKKYKAIQKIKDESIRKVELELLYEEYNIMSTDEIRNPILLHMLNCWSVYESLEKEKEKEKKNKNKKKSSQKPAAKPISQNIEVNYQYTEKKNELKPKETKPKQEVYNPFQYKTKQQLEKMMMDHVEKEEYEEAAIIKNELERRDRRAKRKG